MGTCPGGVQEPEAGTVRDGLDGDGLDEVSERERSRAGSRKEAES